PPPSCEEVRVTTVATPEVTDGGLTENECTTAFKVAVAAALAVGPAGGVTIRVKTVVCTTLATWTTLPEVTATEFSVALPPANVGLRKTLSWGLIPIAVPLLAVPLE